MIYGYARVSTVGQARDGNSLEAQEQALKSAGAEKIYCDNFTGTKAHRPELDKLLTEIRDGDTLIVVKLDRIARSARHGIDIIDKLLARDITVNVLNMGVMNNTPTGRLIRTVFFAFAEFERDMIVERTKEGKSIARMKDGYAEGRPKKDILEFEYYYRLVKNNEMTVANCCRELGISRATWYNRVRELA